MSTFAIVMLSIGYIFIAGITAGIKYRHYLAVGWPRYNGDTGAASFFTGVAWPICLPWHIAYCISEWWGTHREDYNKMAQAAMKRHIESCSAARAERLVERQECENILTQELRG